MKRETCCRGHEMTPDNLYQRKNGTRECKKCSLRRSKERVRPKAKRNG